MKIWQRYFLSQYLKVLTLFIVAFYGLYVLIDYSSRAASHYAGKLSFSEMGKYYLFTFLERFDIILPLAILIASIKTLTSLNTRNELVALMGSGIQLKVLLRSFLLVALFATLLLYLNEEFWKPGALRSIQYLTDKHLLQKERSEHQKNVHSLKTVDDSFLIYQHFNTASQSFFDVYFVVSADDVFRIKQLYLSEDPPRGLFVDHFLRNKQNQLELVESQKAQFFPKLQVSQTILTSTLVQPRQEPLSQLLRKAPLQLTHLSDLQAKVMTALLMKLAMPWLPLLAFIGAAPFCVRFTRELKVFYIFLGSMITLITFYLIMNAAFILGDNQVVPPLLAIGVPFGFYALLFGYRYRLL